VKKLGLGTLTAVIALMLGLGMASIVRFHASPTANVQPVNDGANTRAQLSPPRIADDAQPTNTVDEVMRPHQVSISPYQIKRLIDKNNNAALQQQWYDLDLEPIWERLDIKKNDADLDHCNYSCHADIAILNLDYRLGKQTLLKLSGEETDRYLLFTYSTPRRGAGETWELLGYIDAFTRWSDCKYRIVTTETQRWLAVEETTGHGAGFGSYADTWYEVNETGVRPVLSYQTSLFAMAWKADASLERETRVLGIGLNGGITSVVLKSSTSHKSSDGDLLLWTTRREATFIKGPGMEKFVFDPVHSEMTATELDPRFGDAVNITAHEFLKYNYRELTTLAISGSAKQKDWLRNYLATCDDSLEKQSLQKALEGTRPKRQHVHPNRRRQRGPARLPARDTRA
jgi:hypothetical protein